jgi:hypothetical protein
MMYSPLEHCPKDDMLVEDIGDVICAMQTVPIITPPSRSSPLKRKTFFGESAEYSSDSEEVSEVLRRIKKIKFPVYITVKTLNGKILELDLDSNDSVHRLKEVLNEVEGIPTYHQKLIFNGKLITENQTLRTCGIQNGSVVYLIVALPHKFGYSGISSEHRLTS